MSNVALYYTIDLKIEITFLSKRKTMYISRSFFMEFLAPKKYFFKWQNLTMSTVHGMRSQKV